MIPHHIACKITPESMADMKVSKLRVIKFLILKMKIDHCLPTKLTKNMLILRERVFKSHCLYHLRQLTIKITNAFKAVRSNVSATRIKSHIIKITKFKLLLMVSN